MKVTLKLFAQLMEYLPDGAQGHEYVLEFDEPTSAHEVIDFVGVPREHCHLVLQNGVYLDLEQRDEPLTDGANLAIWPPVAGG